MVNDTSKIISLSEMHCYFLMTTCVILCEMTVHFVVVAQTKMKDAYAIRQIRE